VACAVSIGSVLSSFRNSMCRLGRTYTVNHNRAEDCCCDGFAVFGIFGRAHYDVVAGGEHSADRAEDYYAEDGDDDAAGGEVVSVSVLSSACFFGSCF
jgi:hypothetical protein